MSQSGLAVNSGGGGGGITTITGDTGSVTGANITVFAENSTKEAGSTVKFVNAGTVSTLKVSDANLNISIGEDAGSLTTSGSENTNIGVLSGSSISAGSYNTNVGSRSGNTLSTGSYNCFYGYRAAISCTTGGNNIAIGRAPLTGVISGVNNIAIGLNAGYLNTGGAESNNIYIGNYGLLGESSVTRIGSEGAGPNNVTKCFMAGIRSVTLAGSAPIAIGSNNQISSLGFGTASQVLTSNGSGVSPTWQPKSLAGVVEVTGSYSVLTTDQVVYVDSASACTITLPATAGLTSGQSFVIKDTSFDASTNNITVIVSGGVVLIDDQASQIIASDGGSFTVRMFNSQYYIE